ncbi:MAG: hypothetical protein M0Z99_19560 [Betaproteobacteria bacterium]|nr:hypothetical protein [Betaproteobacteria bacterium]
MKTNELRQIAGLLCPMEAAELDAWLRLPGANANCRHNETTSQDRTPDELSTFFLLSLLGEAIVRDGMRLAMHDVWIVQSLPAQEISAALPC